MWYDVVKSSFMVLPLSKVCEHLNAWLLFGNGSQQFCVRIFHE